MSECIIGKKFMTNKGYGEVIVLRDTNRCHRGGHKLFDVKFLNTGNIKSYTKSFIKSGRMIDIHSEMIGLRFMSDNSGEVEVLRYVGVTKNNQLEYEIKFIDSGNIKIYSKYKIKNGIMFDDSIVRENKKRLNKKKKIVSISPDNKIYTLESYSEFARLIGTTHSNISYHIRKGNYNIKGWKIIEKESEV